MTSRGSISSVSRASSKDPHEVSQASRILGNNLLRLSRMSIESCLCFKLFCRMSRYWFLYRHFLFWVFSFARARSRCVIWNLARCGYGPSGGVLSLQCVCAVRRLLSFGQSFVDLVEINVAPTFGKLTLSASILPWILVGLRPATMRWDGDCVALLRHQLVLNVLMPGLTTYNAFTVEIRCLHDITPVTRIVLPRIYSANFSATSKLSVFSPSSGYVVAIILSA